MHVVYFVLVCGIMYMYMYYMHKYFTCYSKTLLSVYLRLQGGGGSTVRILVYIIAAQGVP